MVIMRAGLTAAWLFGMGLITYRFVAHQHQPPIPGTMLAASGFFALLAVVAEYQPAAGAATAVAWGMDIAALLELLPGGFFGPAQSGQSGQSGLSGLQKIAAQQGGGSTGTTQVPGTTTAGGRG